MCTRYTNLHLKQGKNIRDIKCARWIQRKIRGSLKYNIVNDKSTERSWSCIDRMIFETQLFKSNGRESYGCFKVITPSEKLINCCLLASF